MSQKKYSLKNRSNQRKRMTSSLAGSKFVNDVEADPIKINQKKMTKNYYQIQKDYSKLLSDLLLELDLLKSWVGHVAVVKSAHWRTQLTQKLTKS
jgi:hypothetical protein